MSEPTRHHDGDDEQDDRRDRRVDDPTVTDRAVGPDSFDAGFPESAGTWIGRYQIKREIASGGMGTVYEAVQEQPRRSVALKLMRAGLGSRAAVRRFQTEAQVLGRLHHPNIAQVYEAGTHLAGAISVPYFAMEYIAGAKPIDSYAHANKLDTIAKLKLFALVCDAVHYGHTRGIIHRDLKPQNVLVGADGVLKVIDFGVARATDSDLTSATLQTNAGAVIGTPQYCSPEQFEGDPNALDERTDVYSLGMLGYELLVGRLPYKFASLALTAVGRVVRTEPAKPPSHVRRELGRDVDAVLLTALQKEPPRRYPDAAALAADVRRLIAGEPISPLAGEASAFAAVRRLRTSATRHPAVVALSAMIVAWLISWKIALPLLYQTPADRWVQSRIVSLVAHGDPERPLQSVKVITINDDTDYKGIAERENAPGINPNNPQSQRLLAALLLQRLADSTVRTVVFDMSFRPPSEFDEEFVRAIRKFRARGGEVIIGTRDWWIGDDDSKLVSPALKPEVTIGCMGASIQGNAPWALELFAEHPNADAVPGLALAAFGRTRNPSAVMSFVPRDHTESVEIRYRKPIGRLLVPAVAGKADPVELSTMRPERSDSVTSGLQKESVVGRFVVPLPSQSALDASTIEIGQLLRARSAQEVATLIDRPVVLVASNRSGVDGPFPYIDGRKIRGFYAQATGLDMLLRGDGIREPRRFHEWCLIWLGVVAGVGVARMRSPGWHVGTLLSLTLLAALVAVLAYQMSWLANPLTCLVPMLVAYAIMCLSWQPGQIVR